MRESPAEASEDSQNDSKPQTQDTSQNSKSETNSKTFVEFDSTPRFRKGFRRKKGESPYVCDMNVKFKKEKKQSTFLNPDPWARLVGSRNTAAIYIDGISTTALYDTGAELQLISKEFCEQNKLKIQPIEQVWLEQVFLNMMVMLKSMSKYLVEIFQRIICFLSPL